MDIAALAFSAVALVIAALAAYYTRKQSTAQEASLAIDRDRRQDEVRDREADARRQIEQAEGAKKATLLVNLEAEHDGVGAVIVTNRGPATAHEVRVELGPTHDGKDIPPWVRDLDPEEVPPGDRLRLPYMGPAEASMHFTITVRWRDGHGPQLRRDVQQVPST